MEIQLERERTMEDISLCHDLSTKPVLTVTSLKSKISEITSIAKITRVPEMVTSFVLSDIMTDDKAK